MIRELEVSIYITCDEKLEQQPPKTACLQPPSPPTEAPKAIEPRKEEFSEKNNRISIQSVSASSSSGQDPASPSGCLPGGGCCCTAAVEDEDEITEHKCTCSGHAPAAQPPKPTLTAPTDTDEKRQPEASAQPEPAQSHHLNLLSGRPQPRTIIRKVLEKAEGESAVVVCGPEGLSDDVRRSVVYLSDERAVHKGTGAQGIYLHVETFGW
jgi:hypothetical protein